MKIKFICLDCGEENYIDDTKLNKEVGCCNCFRLHDIQIKEDGEVLVEKF